MSASTWMKPSRISYEMSHKRQFECPVCFCAKMSRTECVIIAVVFENHCKWHPENRLHVRAAANFLRFDRFMRMRTCDAPKGSRYEQKKELESTSTHPGNESGLNSRRKSIFNMLGAQQVTVEQVVLNDYAGKCTIIETIEVRADKSTAIANHELIPLVHPLSKASNKERTRAPVVHNEIITIGENVIKIVRQIEIDNQKSAVPIIWNQVHRYDLKNIRRDHIGHSMQLCGIRNFLSENSHKTCSLSSTDSTALLPSIATAISKLSVCDRFVSSPLKTAKSSSPSNNSGLTDTSAGGGSESASSEERSPNFLCPASFRSDDTPLRPITGSLHEKYSTSAAVHSQRRDAVIASKANEASETNKCGIIVVEEVDSHGVRAHLELDMRIKVPSMENKNIKVLRCAPTRSIVVGGRVVFQT